MKFTMNSLNQTSRWLIGLVALLFSAVGMAQVSASESVPPWHLQYFSGSQGCDQLEEVLAPARAQEWLSAGAENPIKRPGNLWLRLTSAESIALSSSWIASVEHQRVKELLVAFVSDAEFSDASKNTNAVARASERTLSRAKPARPFQFGSAYLSVELPRNLDPGRSWLFCMTGISNSRDVSQAFLKFYPEALFREKVLQRSQFETVCLAMIFAMALSALFFAVTLRDQVYLWYTGHIIAFAVFELRINGTLFRWLDALPGTPMLTYMIGDLALGVSVFCSCKFALVFLDLPHSFASRPGWHSLIKWLDRVALLTLFFSVATILYRVPQLKPSLAFAPHASNVVIALACIMVLACAIVLSWHGKRLAHFYLASSLPLVLGGIIATAYAVFIDDSAGVTPFLLPLAAFEALVLSLGMADRALSLRLERDDARNSAEHDPLTNKLNRRGLLARLQQAQERTRQNAAESCALLYCDLDFFKRINDEYGHDAGDHCLLHFSETVQEVLRTNVDRQRARRTDDIGRIGGEEFVALLHQCTAQNAVMIAERICAQVRRAPVRWKEQDIAMTVSIGVAMVLATDAPNAALTRADAALYRAKHQGRDRVCLDVVP